VFLNFFRFLTFILSNNTVPAKVSIFNIHDSVIDNQVSLEAEQDQDEQRFMYYEKKSNDYFLNEEYEESLLACLKASSAYFDFITSLYCKQHRDSYFYKSNFQLARQCFLEAQVCQFHGQEDLALDWYEKELRFYKMDGDDRRYLSASLRLGNYYDKLAQIHLSKNELNDAICFYILSAHHLIEGGFLKLAKIKAAFAERILQQEEIMALKRPLYNLIFNLSLSEEAF